MSRAPRRAFVSFKRINGVVGVQTTPAAPVTPEPYTHCPEHGCELQRGRCPGCDSPWGDDDRLD